MPDARLEVRDGAARISGDLTFTTVSALYDEMSRVARSGGLPGSVDLSEVGRIDSAGLALLLEWQAAYRSEKGRDQLMDVSHPPDALIKIARLCDAEAYLGPVAGART